MIDLTKVQWASMAQSNPKKGNAKGEQILYRDVNEHFKNAISAGLRIKKCYRGSKQKTLNHIRMVKLFRENIKKTPIGKTLINYSDKQNKNDEWVNQEKAKSIFGDYIDNAEKFLLGEYTQLKKSKTPWKRRPGNTDSTTINELFIKIGLKGNQPVDAAVSATLCTLNFLCMSLLNASYEQFQEGEIPKWVNEEIEKANNLSNSEEKKEDKNPIKLALYEPQIIWGPAENIDVSDFLGREKQLRELKELIIKQNINIVGICGISGMGKTHFAKKIAEDIIKNFNIIIWISLREKYTFLVFIEKLMYEMSERSRKYSFNNDEEAISIFLNNYFKEDPCLLVLDNLECLMADNKKAGCFKDEYKSYEKFFEEINNIYAHPSCLIFTSQEKPQFFVPQPSLTTRYDRCKIIDNLEPLEEKFRKQIFKEFEQNSEEDLKTIINVCDGHTNSLVWIAGDIKSDDENLSTYVENNRELLSNFSSYKHIYKHVFDKLTDSEQQVMFLIAIIGEGRKLKEIQSIILDKYLPKRDSFQSVLSSLIRRAVLLKDKKNLIYFQISSVLKFVLDRLINLIRDEIKNKNLDFFHKLPLLIASEKYYIIQEQRQSILQPIIEGVENIENKLLEIKSELQSNSTRKKSYAAGNILDLLVESGIDFENEDNDELRNFSNLAVWHSYLAETNLKNFNFSNSDLKGTFFADVLSSVFSVTFSPDGSLLVAGDGNGYIHIWDIENNKRQKKALIDREASRGWVWSLIFIDNNTFVSSHGSGNVIIWNLSKSTDTFSFKHTVLDGHSPTPSRAIAWDNNSRILVSCGDDCKIRFWQQGENEEWQQVKELEAHNKPIWAVAFSHDGEYLASGGDDNLIKLWNKDQDNNWQVIETLKEHDESVRYLAFSPHSEEKYSNELLLASVSQDQTLRLYNVSQRRYKQCWTFPEGTASREKIWLWNVEFDISGRFLAVTSEDHKLRLLSLEKDERRDTLKHNHTVRCAAFSPDSEFLASGSYDQTLKLWQWDRLKSKSQCLTTWIGLVSRVRWVDFRDNSVLASCSGDGIIRLWKIPSEINNHPPETVNEFRKLKGHNTLVSAVAFSSNSALFSCDDSGRILEWDPKDYSPKEIINYGIRVRAIAITKNGKTLAFGANDGTIHLYKRNAQKNEWEKVKEILNAHKDWVWSLIFSPDEKVLASGSEDGTFCLWNVGTGNKIFQCPKQDGQVFSVTFSPDGEVLATGSGNGTVKLWNAETGEYLTEFKAHKDWVWSVAFQPNRKEGYLLASGSSDKTVKLWCFDNIDDIRNTDNPQSKELGTRQNQHSNWVKSVAFSPNGEILASGSYDQTIILWDMRNIENPNYLTTLKPELPYEGMNIKGIKNAEKNTLRFLGAIE